MKIFKDKSGLEWTLELNVAAARRLKAHEIDIMQALESREQNLLAELAFNPLKLVDCLYLILQPICQQRGITDEAFAEIFDGASIETATKALLAEIADFFPQARRALGHAIARLGETTEKAQDLAIAKIDQQFKKLETQLAAPGD